MLCYLRDHFGKHEEIPFVEDYKLVIKGPNRAEIIVIRKERGGLCPI